MVVTYSDGRRLSLNISFGLFLCPYYIRILRCHCVRLTPFGVLSSWNSASDTAFCVYNQQRKDMGWRTIKVGETYNGVKILADLGCDEKHKRHYMCLCPICQKEFVVPRERIDKTSHCRSCNALNLVGQRFGLLTVIERDTTRKGGCSFWKCKCDCGGYITTRASCLKSGDTKSCGCLFRTDERIAMVSENGRKKRHSASLNFIHRVSKHPLYQTWMDMRRRCNSPVHHAYEYYGGRGIKVCDRWNGDNGFENFVADMGERPGEEYSIDRIDVNGDYCPENCRWAIFIEQMNNTRRNSYVIYKGNKMSVSEFSRISGISNQSTSKFLCMGLDINYIVSNSHRYRKGKIQRREGHYNHNRVVSDEVIKLLESKTI